MAKKDLEMIKVELTPANRMRLMNQLDEQNAAAPPDKKFPVRCHARNICDINKEINLAALVLLASQTGMRIIINDINLVPLE